MMAGRSILMALVAGVFLWLASGLITSDRAVAGPTSGCNTCNTPPPTCNTCNTPRPPPTPPPSTPVCCTPNHNVYVPGVNVYVAPSVVVNTNAAHPSKRASA